MKILLGMTKEWTTVERRKLKTVDLCEFLTQHYPREHGWKDEKEALVFLESALGTEYLHHILRAMKNDPGVEITKEEPELTHRKFWFEMCEEDKT